VSPRQNWNIEVMKIKNVYRIAAFTVRDELHSRSFFLLAAISVLFVLMIRGCFNADMVVNDQKLDSLTIGWTASMAAFHVISAAGVLIGILLAMRVFHRDKDNGMTVAILSKPIKRIEYIAGKIFGVWILSYALVFLLHLTVYLIMFYKTGGRINWFIPASFLISLNVLFSVITVLLFSLLMPDIIAALSAMAIAVVSYISDSIFAASKTEFVKSLMEQIQQSELSVALWRIIWPKIAALQFFATSLIKDETFYVLGPLHPVFNILIFCVIAFCLLYWRYSREEIR